MKKMSWGTGISVVILVFFLAMGILLSIAMTHTTDLVADNYYEKELKYQDRITSAQRAVNVQDAVRMVTIGDTLTVSFAPGVVSPGMTGVIHLYRPSDKQKDFEIGMKLDSLRMQKIGTSSMVRGLWKVEVSWKAKGGEYYSEQPIVVN